MTPRFTPEQTRAAARVRALLNPDTPALPGIASDPTFRRFAAAVVNQTLTYAAAAFIACAEEGAPALPLPSFVTFADGAEDEQDAAAAVAFASQWIVTSGSGVPGPDRGQAAAWFRTRTQVLPAVAALAAENGWDQQCWQIVARCQAALIAEGALRQAGALSAAGLAAAERCRDRRAVALMHLACGAVAKMSGRLGEAMEHYDAAMPILQMLGDACGQAATLLCRGAVHMARRELQSARNCQLDVLNTAGVPPVLTALATGNLGHIAMESGEIAEAIRCGNAALQIIDGAALAAVRQVMEVNRDLAEAHLANGDLHAANRHVADARRAAEATGEDMTFASVHVAVHLIAGQVALAEGDTDTALREFTQALAVRCNSTARLADLLEGVGLAALAEGNRPIAVAVMQAALAQRRVDGVAYYTAGTLAHMAYARRDEDGQKIVELRNEALALLEPLNDSPAAKLRGRLAAV